MADHSATCILRRNFPDLTVTLLALVLICSDANLTKTSPPLWIGQCSVEIRPNFGQRSVNLWLNFGRKGGEEAGCLVDESCSEQGVSRPNGCFELSYVGLWSGDWYVRSLANALSQQEATGQGSPKDAHLDHGIEEGLRFTNHQVFLTEQAVGQSVPIDDEDVARFEVLQQDELDNQQVAHGLGRHANDQANQ